MHMFRLLIPLFAITMACQHDPVPPPIPEPPPVPKETIDLLCLGDSYTKGEGVAPAQNFPNQLADSLRALRWTLANPTPRIIGQTGWRTDQLKTAINNATDIKDSTFSIVTLCIGVNNQYQNSNISVYFTEFEQLLQTAIERAGNRPERVIVLSIPDWAYTTFGQNFPGEPTLISDKIDQYNLVNKAYAEQYGVHYVDVTPLSREGLVRTELVATDGLHPSGIQYTGWVQKMLPIIREALEN
jgi:acyl-CoA thioesterase I